MRPGNPRDQIAKGVANIIEQYNKQQYVAGVKEVFEELNAYARITLASGKDVKRMERELRAGLLTALKKIKQVEKAAKFVKAPGWAIAE